MPNNFSNKLKDLFYAQCNNAKFITKMRIFLYFSNICFLNSSKFTILLQKTKILLVRSKFEILIL